MKSNKGITLIALIITIIVLLILAGVTIALTVGNNGVITKAQGAQKKQSLATFKEQIELKLAEKQMEYKINKKKSMNVEEFLALDQEVSEDFYISEDIQPKRPKLETELVVDNDEDTKGVLEVEGIMGMKFRLILIITVEEDNKWKEYRWNFIGGEYKGSIGINKPKESTAPIELQKYILGEDLQGRSLIDFATQDIRNNTITYKDDPNTIPDASTSITDLGNNIIRYKEKIYSYLLTLGLIDGNMTSITDKEYGVQEIVLGGRAGSTVRYDGKDWIILYDDNENGLQMISKEVLKYNGGDFTLGYNDSSVSDWNAISSEVDLDSNGILTNFEKAIYSYNNAISTLNNACESLVTPSSNIESVRCVGTNPVNKDDESDGYFVDSSLIAALEGSDQCNPDSINNKIKAPTDFSSMDDKIMGVLDCKCEEQEEIIPGFYGTVKKYFMARMINEYNMMGNGYFISIDGWSWKASDPTMCKFFVRVSNSDLYVGNVSNGLRPVIKLKSDVKFTGSGTEADPYIFN